MKACTLPLLLCLLLACTAAERDVALPQKWTLHAGWNLRSNPLDSLGTMPATVPGTVHTDLYANGFIVHPFRAGAEVDMQWIESRNWVYSLHFELDAAALKAAHKELHFEGLDTYASVLLNGVPILQADNMFRSWTVPVNNVLRYGDNVLEVHFTSPVERMRPEVEAMPYRYPSDNDSTGTSPMVRKAAYHFGWDWAPRFVTSGIWRPVELRLYDSATIRNFWVEQLSLSDSLARLRAHVEVESFVEGLKGILELQGHTWEGVLKGGKQHIAIDFSMEHAALWWPNGHGAQVLHDADLVLRVGAAVVDSLRQRFGLRSLRLVNEADSIGTSFFFEVNGKPIFAKGANYVPQDVFLPQVDEGRYRALLIAAKDAGMNMLRVWGGGVYERDLFYGLCDSLGLLVWQDFMFAGTMYPGDSVFAASVSTEAAEQVRRLRKHACLALWCGNNEIEVAWRHWGWQQKYGYSSADTVRLWRDYRHIFREVLPQIVMQYSPHIPYIASTPQSNWGTAANFNHGAMHYWGVWHGREPLDAFAANVGRFMVEYGVQSYPHPESLSPWLDSLQLKLGSEALRQRQKSYIGDAEIWRYIHDLGMEAHSFSDFAEASQTAQAYGLRRAIEAHRNSGGHCMGSLIWQLNDCWPGPSWSIIDYSGGKKQAYRTVQAAFED